ncbi:MAG: tRNA 2-thiouridine(34) synthase MnmA [Pseudomonadales bacterium]|nr:tRNA 2-thiouridine(34) synthase MnmA [Pseudomonadales bacterium]
MNDNSNKTVIVGMSGGVDSSVSALLLIQQGYQVQGLFMKNWDEDDGSDYCTAIEDLADAQAVADKLKIPLHTANFAAEYWDNVFEHFLEEYKAGRTPNPDILCNKEIKFKAFLEYAVHLGADYIATGHYVRKRDTKDGPAQLLKGLDSNKDQSYFLHAVAGSQIAKTLFPVGEMEKPAVRLLAEQHDLITANKKDSTGICFIGERRFKDFLEQYIPAQPGDIITDEGEIIGKHNGLMFHTLGQRQGLGIGGLKNHTEDAWYVVDKDLDSNQLVVGQGNKHPLLFTNALQLKNIDWVEESAPELPLRCMAKTRYRQPDQGCTLSIKNDYLEVIFDEPQRAVTPGQSVVFYSDDICLGGGVIEKRLNV